MAGQIAEPVNVRSGPAAAGRAVAAAVGLLAGPGLDPGLLGLIVDAVADGLTVQGRDGRLVLANVAAARLAGYQTADELIAGAPGPVRDRFELFGEDRRPLAWGDLPGADVLRGSPRTSKLVGFRDRETAAERWSLVTATPIRDARGEVEFAVNAFHDVTAMKAAEEDLRRERAEAQELLTARLGDEVRLAELVTAEQARSAELNAIIGAIGEGIIVVDADGTVSLANRTAEELLGSTNMDSLDEPLDRLALPPEMDLAGLAAHGPIQARLQGSARQWLEVAAYPVATYPVDAPDHAGGSMILILRDVTDAREREQARDAFIGVLSHELRTPVTTIYAGSELLARGETKLDAAARAGIFEDIHEEAERLHRLVEDVVALTRFGEGALEIGSEPVLLQRVLPAVVRSEQRRWPTGRFDLELPNDLPPVAGETTYVEQVVRNFLANAMKYSGSDAVVRIAVEVAPSGAEVEVRVLDAGPGFPEAEADRLFELYYRSPSVSRKVSGSGIGLFVCARLIDAMGGYVWAVNHEGAGAEFGFALRVVPADR
ncbi:MAG TPA: ATP-binding protein [Candidatus Limnocylindrales bacterium]|nr:ATP-binding protein [Candidatus Limnocylindrales bacterium]